MPYYYLTPEDKRLLDWVISDAKNRLGDPINRRSPTDEVITHQAPEVYICYPQDDPNQDSTAGTGTGTYWIRNPSLELPGIVRAKTEEEYDTIGSEKCDIYQIVDANGAKELRPICGRDNKEECHRRVYNVGERSIVDQFVIAFRDKFGNFLTIPTSGPVKCMLAEDHPGRHTPGATAYEIDVWPGKWCSNAKDWMFSVDDDQEIRTATDSFYGGSGFTYPSKYSQVWATAMMDNEGNVIYSVISGDCDYADDKAAWKLPCEEPGA